MLTIILGNVGSGKTLILTYLTTLTNMKIVSNYHLLKLKYTEFNSLTFIEGKYDYALIALDEAYSLIESRQSNSIRNRLMSYIMFQQRKKNIDLVLTAQLFGSLDVRFRAMANYVIFCLGITPKGFHYVFCDMFAKTHIEFILSTEKAMQLYEEYDTLEVIEPPRTNEETFYFMDNVQKKTMFDEIVEKIIASKEKITHDYVKVFLSDNNYPKTIESEIYARVKLKLKENGV